MFGGSVSGLRFCVSLFFEWLKVVKCRYIGGFGSVKCWCRCGKIFCLIIILNLEGILGVKNIR